MGVDKLDWLTIDRFGSLAVHVRDVGVKTKSCGEDLVSDP